VRQLLAIARREIGAFLHSAISPVVLVGFLALTGLFFTLFTFGYSEMSLNAMKSGRADPNLNFAEGVFQPLVADMTIFLLFLLPAVTMRLFAEEYRSGRYDLVMSYPVPDRTWVGGKFLAVVLIGGLLLLASGFYFGVAAWLGNPEPGPALSAGLGLILLIAMVAAWGIFFSTLFQYQVVSYFLTFAFALLIYTLGGLEPHLPTALGNLIREVSLLEHFQRFSRGVVDSRDLIYFLGWIAVGLAAATASLGGRRLATGPRLVHWLPVCLLAALLVVVYLITARHPFTWDWTRNQRYSLAPQTVQVLRSLDQDIRVHAFYQNLDPHRQAAEVLLRACRDHTPHLQFNLVDPNREVGLVQEYGVTKARTMIIEVGERRADLLLPDETAFINTVYRLSTGKRPVIYNLMGHGEHRIDSDDRGGYSHYASLLSAQGYVVRSLMLARNGVVPSDADIVVIAAPKLDYSGDELQALDDYIRRGGAVLAMLDPITPDSLSRWTESFNVRLGNDVIVSAGGERRQFGVDQRVVVIYDTYGEHPITRGLDGLPTLFPFTQALTSLRRSQVGLTGQAILVTGPLTWTIADRDRWSGSELDFVEGTDRPGPLAFGVALEVTPDAVDPALSSPAVPRVPAPTTTDADADNPVLDALEAFRTPAADSGPTSVFTQTNTARLVIMGDSDFAVNENLNLYGNQDLLLNLFGWLAREQVLIALQPRSSAGDPVVLTVGQKEAIGWGGILGWPLLVGAVGLGVVLRHRRRT
jgi:ABC-type transport system involved in multi-copper enzyme maturation permease subunit/ABC-type uncharacterized transport system involved in gliding motility auxiliary subunit